jgi:hypothetical protein
VSGDGRVKIWTVETSSIGLYKVIHLVVTDASGLVYIIGE